LLLADTEGGLTLQEIERQGAISFSGGMPVFSHRDLRAALARLVTSKRIVETEDHEEKRYAWRSRAYDELWEMQRSSERRVSSVVYRLFGNARWLLAYTASFMECLSIIFSQLGEAYVRLLKGDIVHKDYWPCRWCNSPKDNQGQIPELDGQVFEAGVITFFRDSHPDYDAIKWNMGRITMSLKL